MPLLLCSFLFSCIILKIKDKIVFENLKDRNFHDPEETDL